MTVFLQNNGFDLIIATVTAPLTIYGLHRMSPTPQTGFLAVACTLNSYVLIGTRDWMGSMVKKCAGRLIQEPTNADKKTYKNTICTAASRIGNIFHITISALLPIFWRFMGQSMGIQVPDYIQLMGYLWVTSSVYAFANHSIGVLQCVNTNRKQMKT